jgi:hypothetical protein
MAPGLPQRDDQALRSNRPAAPGADFDSDYRRRGGPAHGVGAMMPGRCVNGGGPWRR